MIDEERLVRDGLAELVRAKPDLGRIDLDEVTRRAGRSGGVPMTRWLAIAAVAVLVAGLGIGWWFGFANRPESQVVIAQPSTPTTPLVETLWLVTEIRSQEAVVDSQGRVPSLRFEDGTLISGSDPCNRLSGSYRYDLGRLTIFDLNGTEMACDPVKQQGRYRAALNGVTRFQVRLSASAVSGPQPTGYKPDILTLFNAADRPVLVFRAAADPGLPPSTTVQVRIRNDGDVDFDKVVVSFGRNRADYGPVAAGKVSDYRRADEAYHYAAIRVTVDGRELRIQPRDYVGETPLPPGRYTYVLTAGIGSLDLRFEADQ